MAALLAGKAALITGSTSGIGLAMARALAGAGANVTLHGFGDRSSIQKVQDELQSSHGIKTAYSDADLKQPAKIRDMVKQVCTAARSGVTSSSSSCASTAGAYALVSHCPCRPTKSLDGSIFSSTMQVRSQVLQKLPTVMQQ
jgi:NAD(P)-dependent dehydrogenase (short-subunit alcohol dehydrogenase family)